ncbi:MAG: aminotransferase class I/II-fold pyridoxal phosphate-dependent enzyme, partial [Bacteroidota bacterium]
MAAPLPYPRPEEHLQEILDSRTAQGLQRTLRPRKDMVDLASNDYLGLSRSTALHHDFATAVQQRNDQPFGAGGSRLLTGNSAAAERLEAELAAFHGFAHGLLFNSGYQANLGVFSSIASRHDTLILDEKAHASMIDGARLSRARLLRFRHNDPSSLHEKLQHAQGRVVVGIESVYSMGGTCAPLRELLAVCRDHGAGLVVDEAHAVGVFGPQGAGRLAAMGLQHEVLAAV